ncbi:hypothetical protein ACIQNU_38360 [Streptomyces sp. NPDC091292]|uniref:hypothetical protein n=1 Tax=Streptomyces sp. NPDC091292 TaxID=3365991 RepID=UPI0037F51ABC
MSLTHLFARPGRFRSGPSALSRVSALSGALLAAGLLLGPGALPAAADASPSPSASDGSDAAPTEAGTSFRTATEIRPDQRATASGSTGDYLYWSFPADAGTRPTVRATVKLPDAAGEKAASTWRVDVYDGLRRRQACMYGVQSRAVDAGSVSLSCTLRPVRAWAEQWANDPLPGTYYIRLTAVGVDADGLGLPVRAEVETVSRDVGGSYAVDGKLSTPLVPGVSLASDAGGAPTAEAATLAGGEPDDGWASGWWTDRWLWTAGGGVLAALAGVAGHALTRGRVRPVRGTPGA